MENLRVTVDPDEIYTFVEQSIFLQANIILWQNINGKRQIYKGHFISLNDKQLTMQIIGAKSPSFTSQAQLYIRGSHRSILFKSNISKVAGNQILIPLPGEIRAIESRLTNRVRYDYPNAKQVTIEKYTVYKASKKKHTAKLMDISSSGMGIITTYATVNLFKEGDSIALLQLEQHTFSPPIEGTIAYVKGVNVMEDQNHIPAYRIGVKFERHIDKNLLAQII